MGRCGHPRGRGLPAKGRGGTCKGAGSPRRGGAPLGRHPPSLPENGPGGKRKRPGAAEISKRAKFAKYESFAPQNRPGSFPASETAPPKFQIRFFFSFRLPQFEFFSVFFSALGRVRVGGGDTGGGRGPPVSPPRSPCRGRRDHAPRAQNGPKCRNFRVDGREKGLKNGILGWKPQFWRFRGCVLGGFMRVSFCIFSVQKISLFGAEGPCFVAEKIPHQQKKPFAAWKKSLLGRK